jgi:hypothetical protein
MVLFDGKNYWLKILLGIFFLWLLISLIAKFLVEILWFQELGYLSTFLLRFQTKTILWLITFIISVSFFWFNLKLAENNCWQQKEFKPLSYINPDPNKIVLRSHSPELKLKIILPLVVFFCFLISFS